MFDDLETTLQRGELPDPVFLRGRFRAALTKKLAVVKLPAAFWSGDPKINPRSDHLLWAALLLADREGVSLVSSVIAAEIAEKSPGDDLEQLLDERISRYTQSLLALAPSREFREELARSFSALLT